VSSQIDVIDVVFMHGDDCHW